MVAFGAGRRCLRILLTGLLVCKLEILQFSVKKESILSFHL